MTTRQTTQEGFLRAGATLTRGGPIDYLRSEIGMTGDGMVTVNRTLETISHPATLASLRGAPITLGHPDGGVTPENYQDVVVGAVAGDPRVAGLDVLGDVLVGDQAALVRLDQGIDELSTGYDFTLGANFDTIGPMIVNHVAIVPRGRAGKGVRIMDSAEEYMPLTSEDAQVIADAMSAAIDRGGPKHNMDSGAIDAFRKEMMDAISPVMDGMKAMRDEATERQKAEDAAKAEQSARDAAEKLVSDTETRMRENFAVFADAMPLLPEERRAELAGADAKTVLVAALADSVPDAANQSADYLRGALAVHKARIATTAGQDGLPPGVRRAADQQITATDAREASMQAFVAAQTERYNKAGGI